MTSWLSKQRWREQSPRKSGWPAEEARGAIRPILSREPGPAHQVYLQGNYHLARGTPAALEKAQEYFEQAIEHDKQYAPPHAGLAAVLVQLGTMDGFLPAGAVHAPAITAAQKALALDPSLAEGHIALGRIKSRLEWDWAAADAAFRQGMQLGPSSSLARLQYANYLTAVGRFEESIAIWYADGRARSPPSAGTPGAGTGVPRSRTIRRSSRDVPKGLGVGSGDQVLSDPPSGRSLSAGRKDDRCDQWPRCTSHVGRRRRAATPPGVPGYLYGKTGHRTEALRAVSELRKRSATDYVPPSSIGNIYVGLNRREDALDEFERAFAQRDPWLVWLKVHPLYDEIEKPPALPGTDQADEFPWLSVVIGEIRGLSSRSA